MIKNIGSFEQTLNQADAKGWKKSVDLEGSFNVPAFEGDKKDVSFGDFLAKSLAEVNSLQSDANTMVEKLAAGETKDLHETLIMVEKAEIAFKTMNQIRNKVIDAYKEIMRMQI